MWKGAGAEPDRGSQRGCPKSCPHAPEGPTLGCVWQSTGFWEGVEDLQSAGLGFVCWLQKPLPVPELEALRGGGGGAEKKLKAWKVRDALSFTSEWGENT